MLLVNTRGGDTNSRVRIYLFLHPNHSELASLIGGMLHASALREHVLVVNTREDTAEPFERRSAKYSGLRSLKCKRDSLPLRRMLRLACRMGWESNVALLPYDDNWRLHRKISHGSFSPKHGNTYHPLVKKYTRTSRSFL